MEDGTPLPASVLDELLDAYGVAGVSIAVLRPGSDGVVVTQVAGLSCRDPELPMFDSTWLEIASLSKTVAAAFMLEYFKSHGVAQDAAVNPLLREAGSAFELKAAEGQPPEWSEQVTLAQLVNHTGLGMHYVNGIPLSEPMPAVCELISGGSDAPAPYGYASLELTKEPGTRFGYSGGGFLVLQHLLELREGRPIAEIMVPFLRAAGTAVSLGLSFETKNVPGKQYAEGYRDDAQRVQDGRLMFPPLAAGALGTPAALLDWLRQLALAYKRPEGSGGVSHETAVQMLTAGPDLGSEAFMRARVGLGVFVFESKAPDHGEPSKWMLHQAANDGFRGLYLVCFDGPDAALGPRGFVILSNGDNNAMLLNCCVARRLLQSDAAFDPPLSALDWTVPAMGAGESDGDCGAVWFSLEGLKQEEIVNMGIQALVLNAFVAE
jgi:CubicO group peptidase (beta-lactamase class C family)